MPMPSKGCAADVPGDVCCDSFYLIGERIRTVAFHGVCSCIDPDCVDREFASYSTEGEIHSILGESLAMTFLRARLVALTESGKPKPTPITRLEYRLELRENNWPLPAKKDASTETLYQADWQMLHALSRHARGHGEKMWRSVVHGAATTDVAQRIFNPSLHPFILGRGIAIGDLTPLRNTGPQVGYEMTVTVDTQLL